MLGELTNRCSTGDFVKVTGTLLPEKISRTTICQAFFLMLNIQNKEKDAEKQDTELSEEEVKEMTKKGPLYEVLAQSICPSIVGKSWANIKKGLLLQMVGGNKINAGLNIRGNIHILLVGKYLTIFI